MEQRNDQYPARTRRPATLIGITGRAAEPAGLHVPDLLALFTKVRGEALDDDKLLLG